MRTITKVERQKRRKDRYNIYLDDVFAFGVDEHVLINKNLHKGLQLSDKDIDELMDEETIQSAYLLAVRYLSYRIRSIQEMEVYLRRKEIEDIVIQKVIVRLLNEKLLDDTAFARAFVSDRKNLTSKGPQIIKRELLQKGIKEDIVIGALEAYTFEDQLEKTLKWTQREANKKSRYPAKKREEQLRLKLMQKGFNQDVIAETLTQIEIKVDTEEEKRILTSQADKLRRRYERNYSGYELNERLRGALYQRGFPGDLIREYMDKLDESL